MAVNFSREVEVHMDNNNRIVRLLVGVLLGWVATMPVRLLADSKLPETLAKIKPALLW